MHQYQALYFDLESTGLDTERDQIIEIAAYNCHTQQSFCSFVKPTIPISKEASAISGITEAMVANAPSIEEVCEEFLHFCGDNAALIAHNAESFDRPLFCKELKRASKALPTKWIFIDTLRWARKYRPDLPKHQLQFLREVYGIPANTAHRALDDVMVLHQIFTQMIDDLSIEKVHQLLQEEKKLHHMPFGKYQGTPLREVPKSYLSWLAQSGAFDKAENKILLDSLSELGLLNR